MFITCFVIFVEAKWTFTHYIGKHNRKHFTKHLLQQNSR